MFKISIKHFLDYDVTNALKRFLISLQNSFFWFLIHQTVQSICSESLTKVLNINTRFTPILYSDINLILHA